MAATTRTSSPGTMRERPPGSGNWQLRAFAGTDPLTGRPRQKSRTFHGSERAAAKALAAFVTEVGSGKVDKTSATLGQLLDRWLEHAEGLDRQRPRTLSENRSKIEHRIRPTLGAIRLDRLGPDTLDAAYAGWLTDGLSPTTVHKYHCIISAALRQAVKWGWIERSPADRASPPAPVKIEMKVPTPEQLNVLHRAAEEEDPVLATAIAVAAMTGMRRSEIVALRWSDIDLAIGTVRVERGITVAGGEIHEGPTKTHQNRRLALDPVAVNALRERWDYMVELSARADSPLVEDPFVLSYQAHGGIPVGPDTLTHRFAGLCRAQEAPARKKAKKAGRDLRDSERWPFRFHDLRHFSVTTLIAAGIDVRTVSERHGHAQATMTLNRYAHALPERDRAAAGVLGRAFEGGR
jgi:integrase